MTGSISYRRWNGDVTAAAEPMLTLYQAVFESADDAYLTSRLPSLVDPVLWHAGDETGWLGFKLGYRRGATFYSWLGGVHPRARGQGVASTLMLRQHEGAALDGYGFVETRTRATNNAMLILNLRHGFQVVGFEMDSRDLAVVTLRRSLC